ncbi:1-acyl-SN-glycerol-3-phosphate acyltransferase [Geomicrobium sp. JCM 19037]|uniref:lysophospholipid acyltransferase family protein n=1 Tax=Geomicrobium sp. JCM 19037 TaxID=1460634 RepID=UPI00045F3695|nr:lysophospholipid acyltransferase family protein [Geomicrobium sp. JCM 19037]GAK02511.1 1-acyl-SN-glycerol-3-phosphate acyltransferase [Geomicrobium sp. JCM 19037]
MQKLFFLLVVKPVLLIVLGMNIHDIDRLPKNGPAVMIANHNSHLDTPLMMNLFPLKKLHLLRPVAAFDYFFTNKTRAWFATRIMNTIPIKRSGKSKGEDVLQPLSDALERGEILIFFPEGSRGEPEQMTQLKSGLAHLISRHRCAGRPSLYAWTRQSIAKRRSVTRSFRCYHSHWYPIVLERRTEAFYGASRRTV